MHRDYNCSGDTFGLTAGWFDKVPAYMNDRISSYRCV